MWIKILKRLLRKDSVSMFVVELPPIQRPLSTRGPNNFELFMKALGKGKKR